MKEQAPSVDVDIRGQLGTFCNAYVRGLQKDVCINHERRNNLESNRATCLRANWNKEKNQCLAAAGHFNIKIGSY